ncbi:metallophosphoesterase [Maridesulfovibrio sp.]|uniref:metallophosphoesterase family protein n=1 Tax=Maridesulfovibrio sp. TaxID=2795000 RepID=UPI003BA9034C
MGDFDFTNSLNMLHLSDLHLADRNLGKIEDNLKALKKDLVELREELNWSPDLIFFTGDAVFDGGDPVSIINFFDDIAVDILQTVGLERDKFIICPGNHEVDRSCFDAEKVAGISFLNNDVEKLESYQTKVGFSNDVIYSTLKNFVEARDDFYSNTSLQEFKGQISFCKEYMIKNNTISVSSLCSSWIAYGGDEDEGKMLIGKKQYNDYVKSCEADVKIVLAHHPLEWLSDFDKQYIQNQLLWDKAMFLCGHMHEHDSSKLSKPQGACVNLQAGALCNDDYANAYHGYTALALHNNDLNCIHRKYFELRKSFDSNNDMGKGGIWTVETELTANSCPVDLKVFEQLELNYPALVSEISDFAPQRVEEIYVFPEIRSVSPSLMRADSLAKSGSGDKIYTEDGILNSDDNYIVVGKQNSGKTSFLSYLQYRFNISRKMAFYVDVNSLPKDKEKIIKSLSYLVGKNKIETKKLLKSANVVLLLDNFIFSKRLIEELAKIKKEFGVRVIVSLQEDYEKALDELAKRISSFNFVKLYIHPFKACMYEA